MNTFFLITCFLSAILSVLYALSAHRVSARRRDWIDSANAVNAAVGTHENSVTRYAENAVNARFLLGKVGASGDLFVDIAGADDAPLFVITDEAADGDPVPCDILGGLGRTTRVTAAGAISVGDEIVAAANGKAQTLPTAPGTYYSVGRALTAAQNADDLIEIAAHPAREIVVS
jgi:hypothetical protein